MRCQRCGFPWCEKGVFQDDTEYELWQFCSDSRSDHRAQRMTKDDKRFGEFVMHPSQNIVDIFSHKITASSLRATMTALIERDNALSGSDRWQ
jgi:hypothetical protein